MPYNPNKHNRKSIRLKGYDYSRAGIYFITLNCQNRICRFGHVENGKMILNEFGQIAHDEWAKLSDRFLTVELGAFQIMPDHMHGIVKIVGAILAVAQSRKVAKKKVLYSSRAATRVAPTVTPTVAPTIGEIIGAYKSLVSNACLKIYKSKDEIMGKLWQRNYYEHIVRNHMAYVNIANYIINNPKKWTADNMHKFR